MFLFQSQWNKENCEQVRKVAKALVACKLKGEEASGAQGPKYIEEIKLSV